MNNSHSKAIEQWRLILGESYVSESGKQFEETSTATFAEPHGIKAVLYPANTDEVSKIVAVALRFGVPIYPVSKGKNFGLGSKLPVNQDCVVVDLERMNSILDFDEQMAWVRLQPGVSFLQLEQFLTKNKSLLMMDSIGSTPHASIVGNALERGHGLGLQADRFAHVCNFEVALADGSVINTGFGGNSDSKVGNLSRWGLGPYTDGLFTQSNFGIVTAMTLWLRPRSKHFQSFVFHVQGDDKLGRLVEKVRELRLSGLQTSLRIFNDLRMISFFQQYPWSDHPQVPLSQDKRTELRSKYDIKGEWVGIGAVYPLNAQYAAADRNTLEDSLKQFTNHWEFLDEADANRIARENPERKEEIEFLYTNSSLRGLTSDRPISMCYWRKKSPIPLEKDIHRDKCGVLWYCPVIPARDEDVRFSSQLVESVSGKHGFEPNIGFLFITERALDITGAICYDREVEGEDKRAMACHHELLDSFAEAGYPPYRLGVQSMHIISKINKQKLSMHHLIKSALDPEGIISPGRYLN